MHIPDGLMDPLVALVGFVEFLAVIAFAVAASGSRMREKDLPRVAVLSAGIFVAQMVNFPVGGGTTGHLIGGALLAIIAGPVIAIIGMTVVVLIQALMFGDGGLTAFGLNAVNMAIIAPLIGWGVYSLVKQLVGDASRAASSTAIAAGAWASVFVAAAACAAELSVSHAISGGAYGIAATVAIPAMLVYHAVIGIGEAVITAGIILYLQSASPEAFRPRPRDRTDRIALLTLARSRTFQAAIAVLTVFALALPFYFLYASEGADGLEQTMADAGTDEGEPLLSSPFSYGEDYFAALFAGLLGFTAVMLLALTVMAVTRSGRAETRLE